WTAQPSVVFQSRGVPIDSVQSCDVRDCNTRFLYCRAGNVVAEAQMSDFFQQQQARSGLDIVLCGKRPRNTHRALSSKIAIEPRLCLIEAVLTKLRSNFRVCRR